MLSFFRAAATARISAVRRSQRFSLGSVPPCIFARSLSSGPDAASKSGPATSPNASTSSKTPDSVGNSQPNGQDPTAQKVQDRMREWSANASVAWKSKADQFSSSTRSNFSQLGAYFNTATGYDEIEGLKKSVIYQEKNIKYARIRAKEAKLAYQRAVSERSRSQNEVQDILQRKSSWDDFDLERFAALAKKARSTELEEAKTKDALDEADEALEREFRDLTKAILERYHEEQVWSDKIRAASTYGSMAVMGINVVVFVLAMVLVEPWKRRRLARTFESKVEELAEEIRERMGSLEEREKVTERVIVQAAAEKELEAPVLDEKQAERSADLKNLALLFVSYGIWLPIRKLFGLDEGTSSIVYLFFSAVGASISAVFLLNGAEGFWRL